MMVEYKGTPVFNEDAFEIDARLQGNWMLLIESFHWYSSL